MGEREQVPLDSTLAHRSKPCRLLGQAGLRGTGPYTCCMKPSHQPRALTLHQQSRQLEVHFDDERAFFIPFELMRVYSPSAEVQGHGPGQETLQTGKREVGIESLETVGHYAIQPLFSDGHNSGIFSWDYLYFLGDEQAKLWADYEARLSAAGMSRDAPMVQAAAASCGHQH
jgi:DUF971 family protein